MPTYRLVTTDADLIDWLTNPTRLARDLGGQQVAEPAADGAVITGLDVLRTLPADRDGSVTDDDNGLALWVEGDPHPLTPA